MQIRDAIITCYMIICLYNFPFQSTVAAATIVVEEHRVAHAAEYHPDVPGISDRRTGVHLYFFKYFFPGPLYLLFFASSIFKYMKQAVDY